MKLRTFFTFILCLTLTCMCLIGCNDNSGTPQFNGNQEMETVMYSGHHDYLSDGVYVVSRNFDGYIKKYNIKTDRLSRACNCLDKCDDDCMMKWSNRVQLYALRNGKIYYSSFYPERGEDEVANKSVYYLACTDLVTHESRKLYEITASEYETFQARCFQDNYAYYVRNIPQVSDPKNEQDYLLSMCRMDLDTAKEQVLFTAKDQSHISKAFPRLILKDGIVFGDMDTGNLWKVDLDGSNFRWIVKSGTDVPAIEDSYGIFYKDGYIYYASYAKEMLGEIDKPAGYYIYRVSLENGEVQRLNDAVVKWLFVTDTCIYFECIFDRDDERGLSYNEHQICAMSHTGEDVRSFPVLTIKEYPKSAVTGVWFDGGAFYFTCMCEDSKERLTTVTIKYDVATYEYVIVTGES